MVTISSSSVGVVKDKSTASQTAASKLHQPLAIASPTAASKPHQPLAISSPTASTKPHQPSEGTANVAKHHNGRIHEMRPSQANLIEDFPSVPDGRFTVALPLKEVNIHSKSPLELPLRQ